MSLVTQEQAIQEVEHEARLRERDFGELSGADQEQLEDLLTNGRSHLHDLHEGVYLAASIAAERVKVRQGRLDELTARPIVLCRKFWVAVFQRRLQSAEKTLAYRKADIASIEERYRNS